MKIVNMFFITFLLSACIVNRDNHDSTYKGENNYKNFYVVDTINIENPIIIRYQGDKFVFSKKLIKDIKIDDMFIKRQDVFLLGDNLYYDLSRKDIKRYIYLDDGGCEEIRRFYTLNSKGITAYEYSNTSVRFILCLINANYYNIKHNKIDGEFYKIDNNDQKNSFYKIIYPICK